MRTIPRSLLAAVVSAPLLLAACGSSGGSSSNTTAATPDLHVVAPGGLKFDSDSYTAPAKDGGFSLTFENKDTQSHSVAFKDSTGKKVGPRVLIGPKKSTGEKVDLPAGTYELYCDVPGHEAAGMKATLTVS
jgi:plastocyanin